MELDIFQILTIINSVVLAILPLAFFRRQKLQEIKYKEIMELNVKTHDITQRIDRSLKERHVLEKNEYERLDFLISRYQKHSQKLSNEISEYKDMWNSAIEKGTKAEMDNITKDLLKKSQSIRDLADKLLK